MIISSSVVKSVVKGVFGLTIAELNSCCIAVVLSLASFIRVVINIYIIKTVTLFIRKSK